MEHKDYEPILRDHIHTNMAIERRLTSCLMAYWERLRGDRPMPSETDIAPDDCLSDMWDDCFLIHTGDAGRDNYHFTFVGENVSPLLIGDATDAAQMWNSLNAKRLLPLIDHVIKTKRPLLNDGQTHNDTNQLVKYRQCLLPIGEGDKVLAIFGGMRCKIYA